MDKPAKTPIEDLRKRALGHYEEASNAIHCWDSFVSNAIKAYNPEVTNDSTAHKIMTKEEYEKFKTNGWHEVNKDVDGFGNYGIKFTKEVTNASKPLNEKKFIQDYIEEMSGFHTIPEIETEIKTIKKLFKRLA